VAVVMIGVDPHKGSHTAVATGQAERVLGQVRVRAAAAQAEQMVAWAAGITPDRDPTQQYLDQIAPEPAHTQNRPHRGQGRGTPAPRPRLLPQHHIIRSPTWSGLRYDTKLWMRDLMEGAAYLPK
jgi:transposase